MYLIISLSVASLFMLTSIILLFKSIRLKKRNLILVASLKQIKDMADLTKKDDDSDVHKENFIKFLSDSRDVAYEYIEDVQNRLSQFVDAVEPEISYFDEYGLVGEAYPHYHSMKKISQAYKELKTLLPIEEN